MKKIELLFARVFTYSFLANHSTSYIDDKVTSDQVGCCGRCEGFKRSLVWLLLRLFLSNSFNPVRLQLVGQDLRRRIVSLNRVVTGGSQTCARFSLDCEHYCKILSSPRVSDVKEILDYFLFL